MIFLSQTATSLASAAHFSWKRTDIPCTLLREGQSTDDFCACLRQCVPCLKMFTDEVGTDFYKNDLYQQFLNVVKGGSVVISLIKTDGFGVETTTIVTDDTYGTLTDGSLLIPRFLEYVWDFYKIWNNLGYGRYQMKIENKNIVGNVVQTLLSPCFSLHKYTDVMANGTIRIETEQTGRIKNGNNYGTTTFYQQIRLPGALMLSALPSENDAEQLNDDSRSLLQIKDQLSPEYRLRIDLVSSGQIMMTIFDYLFANKVKVSDYNVYNFATDPANLQSESYRSIPLKRNATEFNPSSKVLRKSFTFTMEYFNKNVFKTNN